MKKLIFAAILSLAGAACSSSDSSSIASDEIYATFEISGDGSKVECLASMTVGGSTGTLLDLTDNDSLHCGLVDTLTAFKGNSGSYKATGLTYTVGETYDVLFSRGQGQCVSKDEQHKSSAKLPAAISITAPANSSTQNRNQDMTVTWAASDADLVEVSISGKKTDSSGNETADTFTVESKDDGSEVISKIHYASWLSSAGITVTVRRINNGTFATSLKGGSIRGVQSDKATLSLSGNPSSKDEQHSGSDGFTEVKTFTTPGASELKVPIAARQYTEKKRCR